MATHATLRRRRGVPASRVRVLRHSVYVDGRQGGAVVSVEVEGDVVGTNKEIRDGAGRIQKETFV